MSNLRELLFEPCPYCPEYAEDNQPCRECDGRGFFLRDIMADCLGEELLEAVTAAEITRAQRDLLLAACEAAIRYDETIQSCANDPDKMASHCTAQGEDLDALYFDWLDRARAAIAAVTGEA